MADDNREHPLSLAAVRQMALERIDTFYKMSGGPNGPLGPPSPMVATPGVAPNKLLTGRGYFKFYRHGILLKENDNEQVFAVLSSIYDCWTRHQDERGFWDCQSQIAATMPR